MRLTAPAQIPVLHVARRAIELEGSDTDVLEIVNAVMATDMAWVAWQENVPIAVLGVNEAEPGFWQIYCFHTEFFPEVILPLTRFIKRTVIPTLFRDHQAIRLEGYARPEDKAIRRWMKLCGGRQEGWRDGRVVYVIDTTNAHL